MKSKIYMSMMLLPMIAMASGTFSIGDRVWHDTNENWEQDSGEKGMANVKVVLYTANGKKVKTTRTNKKGKYHFYRIKEGDYVVKVVAPKDTEIVTDAKLELWLDRNRKDIDFGLHNKNHIGDYSIGDRVWNDTNENWEQDNGEKGIAGVTVNLFKASGEKVATTKTNQKGKYKFKELAEDDYVIKVEVPKDMTAITDTKLEVWLDRNRVDKDFGLLKKSTPPSGEPITLEKLKEMIANGEDVTKVNTSEITDMSRLFYNNKTFNQDISNWDVSNVKNMKFMFLRAYNFNQDISSWDVSKVTNMYGIFADAQKFNQDIGSWDVSKVKNMKWMFFGAHKFNQDISSWNVSNTTNMKQMFDTAYSFNQNISSWDVSKVTDMASMFLRAQKFNQDISSWDVSKVTNMRYMFYNALKFNQDISTWNVSNVRDMRGMFSNAKAFSNHDLSSWDVRKVSDHDDFFNNAGEGNIEPKWTN